MENQTHTQGRGRPSSYKLEFCDKLIVFFQSFADTPFTKEVVSKTTKYYDEEHGGGMKEEHVDYKFVGKKFPTLFGFARSIGVDYDTILGWSKARVGPKPGKDEKDVRPFKYPEFIGAYKQARLFQTEYLTAIGMGGMAPSAFAIFTAKNTIGWRDKNEIGFTDGAGNDRKDVGGFVLLPKRLTDEEAKAEFEKQQIELSETGG